MIQQLINYTTMEQKIDKADLLKNLCGSLALIHESFNDFYNHNIAIENDDNKDQNLIEKFKNLTNSIKDNEYYYYDFYNLDFIKAIQEFILNNDFCLSIKDTILKTTLDGNNEIQSAVMKKINKALDLIEKYLINIKKNNSEDVKNTINSFRKEIYQEFQNIDENQNIQKNTITWDKFKNIFTQCIAINDLIKDDYHSLTHIVSIQNEINNPNCLSKYINEAIMEDNTIIFNQEQFESCIAMKYFFENKLDNNEEKIQLDTNIEISEEEINMLQLYNKNISNYFKDIKKKYNIDLSFQNLSINNQQSINFGVIMVGWCNNMFNNYFNKNNYPNELEKEKKSIKINKEEIQNNINLLNTIIETASISIENNNKVQQMSQHEENDLLEQTRNEKIVYNLLNEKNYKEDISLKTINFTTGLKKIHILDVLQLESNNLQKLAEENNINFNNLKMIHQKKNLEIKVLFNKESKGDSNFKIKALNKIIKNTQLEINHKQLQIKN